MQEKMMPIPWIFCSKKKHHPSTGQPKLHQHSLTRTKTSRPHRSAGMGGTMQSAWLRFFNTKHKRIEKNLLEPHTSP